MPTKEEALRALRLLENVEIGDYVPPMPLIHEHIDLIIILDTYIRQVETNPQERWQSFIEQYNFHIEQFKVSSDTKMMNPFDFYESCTKLEFASMYLNECNNSNIARDVLFNRLGTKLKDIQEILETGMNNTLKINAIKRVITRR